MKAGITVLVTTGGAGHPGSILCERLPEELALRIKAAGYGRLRQQQATGPLPRRLAGIVPLRANGKMSLPDISAAYKPFMDEFEITALSHALRIPSRPLDVLEWGSGNSTLYFSNPLPPASSWTSIEHNREWAEKVSHFIAGAERKNIFLHFVPPSRPYVEGTDDGSLETFRRYVDFPAAGNRTYDFIIVDGRARIHCMEVGWRMLSEDGIMVLHDAQRKEYHQGIPRQAYCLKIVNKVVESEGNLCLLFMGKNAKPLIALHESLLHEMPEHISMEFHFNNGTAFPECAFQGAQDLLECMETNLAEQPAPWGLFLIRAHILLKLGRVPEAIDMARRELASFPESPDAAEFLSLMKTPMPPDPAATYVSTPRIISSRAGKRCLFLNTYYDGFLRNVYKESPGLASRSYREQKDVLQGSCFGDSDFYSKGMNNCGWEAEDLIANCSPLQDAWAKENGFSGHGMAILFEQIKRFRPQVLYIQDLNIADRASIGAARPYADLIIGQIASPIPPNAFIEGFDVMVTSFPHWVTRFRTRGIASFYQPLAFEPDVLNVVGPCDRIHNVTFVGGISPSHGKGLELLDYLARTTPIEFWGYGAHLLPADSPIVRRHRGEVWGKDMFRVLAQSRITVNRHIDVAENHANNMRLFEATGMGALLITDYKDNLNELFEIGKEVVAYRSKEECASLITYYMDHPDEAAAIAAAGQERTLREHRYGLRMRRSAEWWSRLLRYRAEHESRGSVPMGPVSYGYKTISRADVSAPMLKAWQSGEIPAKQRSLVQTQLEDLYRGKPNNLFVVLSELLRPWVRRGTSVCELGCASAYYAEILEYLLDTEIDYCGVDYSVPLVTMGRDYYPALRLVAADGAALSIKDKSFDVVISSCVLLHVPNFDEHIAETVRIGRKVIVAHRTPVCRARPTQYMKKMAYDVETVELRFNEGEIVRRFCDHGLELLDAVEYYTNAAADEYEVTYLFRRIPTHESEKLRTFPTATPSPDPAAGPMTWERLMRQSPVRLYAGDVPNDSPYRGLIGLALDKNDERHILHDITHSMPIPDNSVDGFQAEDFFEHIGYESLPQVIGEIYRVLKPGGLFRLSVPDYRCDVLINRSVRGADGEIRFDPGGGGTVEHPGHVWHPTFEQVRNLLEKTEFNGNGSIRFLHYTDRDGTFVLKDIDYRKGFVSRTPDHDGRVADPRRPMSIVVDLVKNPAIPVKQSLSSAPDVVCGGASPAAPASARQRIVCDFRKGPVVLVSRDIAFTFPLSYAYLAGYLRSKGEDPVVLFKDSDPASLVRKILALNPVLVGFGNLFPELREVGMYINMLNKAGRRFPVVVGGQMVSPTPEFAVEVTGADFGVIGEGEITLHKLVRTLREGGDISSVRGLAIRNGAGIFTTGPAEEIVNIDDLPPVPYDLFPTGKWLPIGEWYAKNCPQPHWKIEDRVINVHGGRGCPYRCNFCYHHSKPRYRSIPVMFAEAAEALLRFDGNMLYFSDDLVLGSPTRAKALVDAIRKLPRRISYSVSTRFDLLARMDDQLLSDMKDSGARIMGLGIESGSDRILGLIGKNCTADTILTQLSRLRRVGILPTVSIMVGQHTETTEDAEASMRLMKETVRENPLIQYAFSIMTPFPGSPLYDLILSQGRIRNHMEFYDRYFSSPGEWKQVVNLSAMTNEQVILTHQRLEREYAMLKNDSFHCRQA